MTNHILISGLNWLGDSIMAMPAIQHFAELNPDTRITLLVKPKLIDLWRMHENIHQIVPMPRRFSGLLQTSRQLRQASFTSAHILPNSLRSALPPWLARIPIRIGAKGHARRALLTHVIQPPTDPRFTHQSWEYYPIFNLPLSTPIQTVPRLHIPSTATDSVLALLGQPEAEWIAICPGAARGPSKQWSPQSFAAVGSALVSKHNCRIAVFGGPGEAEACFATAAAIGPAAVNLAGRTSILQFAAGLAHCRMAVTNDSGGMHLAAATGTPVVAVFGMTDPSKTGPLGHQHTILQAQGFTCSRDIPRHTSHAAAALQSITPETVLAAIRAHLWP